MTWQSTAARAQAARAPEYDVKAAFLYNFMKFVEWPAHALPDSGSKIVLGILGRDPFGPSLDDALKDKRVSGHPVEVKRFKEPQELGTCNALFVCASERERMAQIERALAGLPILTVGDTEQFARVCGIIGFTVESNHVRFEINVERAEHAQLKISSKLLRLATIVRTASNP